MRVKTDSGQSNLFDILAHADGSAGRKRGLDRLAVIDLESFRPLLEECLAYGDQSPGLKTTQNQSKEDYPSKVD